MFSPKSLVAERYELIELLGKGGFSEVWLANDIMTNVLVALKIYASGVDLDDDGITLFTQEFSLVFDTNHTNLLHPTHFDCWERKPYLILPYCKNGSALSYIKNGNTIPETECWKLLYDVSSGLAYLHSKNPPIIHQDIKPDNILIGDEGQYMITDFGISAKIRSTIGKSKSQENISGTLSYMGPERFSATPTPIMASDIWSLGATLFELMTGNPPYENFGGVLQKNGADIPIITNNYSDEIKECVYKCLALNPWDRPTAQELMDYVSKKGNISEQKDPITKSIRPLDKNITSSQQEKPSDSSVKKGEENKFNQPKKKKQLTRPYLFGILGAALVLIIILFSLGNSEEEPEIVQETIPVINYDSICQEKIKQGDAYKLIGDTLFYPLDGKPMTDSLFEDSYIKSLNIYTTALNTYKDNISLGIRKILENKIDVVKGDLDSVSKFLDNIITIMNQQGFGDATIVVNDRKNKINNYINHEK